MAQESLCLLMEVLVGAVHKLVNYVLLCETFCALYTRDRFSCVSYFLINVFDGRCEVLLDSSEHINNIQETN